MRVRESESESEREVVRDIERLRERVPVDDG